MARTQEDATTSTHDNRVNSTVRSYRLADGRLVADVSTVSASHGEDEGRTSAQGDTRASVHASRASSATLFHRPANGGQAVDVSTVGVSNGEDGMMTGVQDDVRATAHVSKVADKIVDAMAEDPTRSTE